MDEDVYGVTKIGLTLDIAFKVTDSAAEYAEVVLNALDAAERTRLLLIMLEKEWQIKGGTCG